MIDVLKNSALLIIFLTIVACGSEKIKMPKLEEQKDFLSIPLDSLYFEAEGNDWEAYIYTFIQPYKLNIVYQDHGFLLFQDKQKGIIEGPGKLVLKHNDQYFTYQFNLINFKSHTKETIVDFRSPKTLNPDSSLYHQKLLYKVDTWQNIIPARSFDTLFDEEEILIPDITGTYRAQESIPLSSYYVQAGSCKYIQIQVECNYAKKQYLIKAGPLMDAYENIISDGTLVTFISFDGTYTRQIETSSKNGFAHIEIEGNTEKKLYAKIDNTISERLKLKKLK